jgi:hypothetical protein
MKMRGTSQEDQFAELESFYVRVENVIEESQPRRKLELSLKRLNVTNYYNQQNKPDWSIWLHLAEITALQAVLLSMDFEPDRKNQIVKLWSLGVSMKDIPIYQNRARVLLSHIGRHGKEFYGNDLSSYIRLTDFIAWAKKLDWDMPEELNKLVCRDIPQALPFNEEEFNQKLGEREEYTKDRAELKARNDELLAENKNKNRNSDLLLISALVQMLGRDKRINTQAHITNTIESENQEITGLSSSRTTKVISEANKLYKSLKNK